MVQSFPHDAGAFTQGLDFRGTSLFEGTGLRGESDVRRVDYESGEVLRERPIASKYFGEGITILGRKLYQITWQEEVCFVYKASTFARIRKFEYEGEGWGLTHNGRRLIMSDGTSTIRFRDPATFEVTREIDVTEDGEPVVHLNELEWIDGQIFANVWTTDFVVRIDPKSGDVVGKIDLDALHDQEEPGEGNQKVTNGIAYLEEEDRLFVTGKNWAHLYEIELTEAPVPSP